MGKYGRYLYECVLAVPLSIAVLLLCYEDLGLDKAGFFPCCYAAASCGACAFLLYLKGKDRLLAAGTIAVLLGLAGAYGLITDDKQYYSSHSYIWLIPAISAGCFLGGFLCKKLRLFRYLAAVGVIASLVSFLVLDFYVTKLCVMLFLSVLILLLADETQVMWKRSGRTDHALHLTFVAPFVFLWLLFCLLFPVGKDPYNWNIIRNLWNKITDIGISISQWGSGKGDDFDSFSPGFSESARIIGGRMKDNSAVLLRVEPVMGTPPSFRLAGEACDTFRNMEWTATITDSKRELEFDTLETRCALEKVRNASDYMQSMEIRVTYRKFTSRHLFVPDKVVIRGTTLAALTVSEQGRNLVYAKKKGLNNQYVVNGYRVNLLHSAFSDLIRNAPAITEEDWKQLTSRADVSAYAKDYENFLKYRESIRKEYVKQVSLPDSAKAFVEEVTEGAETPFERMLRIGQALNGFSYTVSPGRFPSYVKDASSFLEYFLSARRGYCSHFATAMTLFAWSEGLPARYVHGFSVTLNDRASVDVTGDNAHAWCEIYFENIGWIPFDITPGFTNDAYWATSSERNDRIWDSGSTPSTPRTPAKEPEEEEKTPVPIKEILFLVLIGIAILFAFTVLVLLADRVITLSRFARLSDTNKVSALYRRNCRVLSYLGLSMKKEETLSDYKARLSASLPKKAISWIDSYEQFLYGTPDDIPRIVKSLASGNRSLIEVFRKQHRRKYLLYVIGNRLIH